MTNLLKFFVALFFGVVAVGLSAYKFAESKPAAGTFLVQTDNNIWEVRTTEPNTADCQGSATLQCYYRVVIAIPDQDTYDANDINGYLSASPARIAQGDHSSQALYTGP